MMAAPTGRLGQDDPVSRLISLAIDRLTQAVPALRPMQRPIEMVTRYVGVGVASSLLYAFIVVIATTGLRIAPNVSALVGYAIVIPVNFSLHRRFTFRSVDGVQSDLGRYACAQIIGMVVSYAAMALSVDVLRLPYGFGIVGAIILVPILSYLLMDRWVFAKKAG